MIPANLIVNADDFGIDPRVSKAIAYCLENGLINSFSVLPFTDAFHDELLKSLIARFPHAHIGCHLSLLDSSRLSESPHYYRNFLKLYLTGRYRTERIYKLWKDQVLFLGKYLGGTEKISHLDSHQHLHILPGIWSVTVRLKREFEIPRLRVPYESLSRSLFFKFPFGFAFQVLSFYRYVKSTSSQKPSSRGCFIGFFTSTTFTLEANRQALKFVIEKPKCNFELMVHPALPADANFQSRTGLSGATVQASQELEVGELEKLKRFYLTLE